MKSARLAAYAALILIVAIAGCSGGGAITPRVPAAGAVPGSTTPISSSARVMFRLSVPTAKLTTSGYRRTNGLSFATESISIALVSVNGTATNATPTTLDITPTSPSCMSDPQHVEFSICSVSANEPVGTDAFSINAYDGFDGQGTRLAAGNVTATVPASGTASIPLTFDGIVASATIRVDQATVASGTAVSANVFVEAQDADGAAIVGSDPYQTPILLSVSDPQNLMRSISSTTVTAPNVSPVLKLDATNLASATLTVNGSAAGISPSAIVPATIAVSNDRNWNNGNSFHYTGTSTVVVSGPTFASTTTNAPLVSDETFKTVFGSPEPYAIQRTIVTTTGTPGSSSATTSTTLSHYILAGDFATSNLITLDATVTDSYGGVNVVDYSGDAIVDELPEKSGQTWNANSNYSESYTPSSTSPYPADFYGQSSDGSYSATDTYANGDIATSIAYAMNSTYTYARADGTSLSYTFAAPTAAASGGPAGIAITQTIATPAPTPAPSAQPTFVPVTPAPTMTTAPNWYPTTWSLSSGFVGNPYSLGPLANDTYVDMGSQQLPNVCGVNAAYGTSANHLQELYQIVDPIVGEAYSQTRDYWVIPGTGVVCRQVSQIANYYYNLSLASNTTYSLATIFPGTLQYSVSTTTALGLQSISHVTPSAAMRNPNGMPSRARSSAHRALPPPPRPGNTNVARVPYAESRRAMLDEVLGAR